MEKADFEYYNYTFQRLRRQNQSSHSERAEKESYMSSVPRFLGFSLQEWILLSLGIAAAAFLYWCFPEKWWKIYVIGFGLGFLFEASMDPLFSYAEPLSGRHCVGNTDVNFLFPFGWIFIASLAGVIAEKLLCLPLIPGYIISGLIAGNTMELIFFKSKWWEYNYDAFWIGKYRPFIPKVPVYGVPLQVVIGYCNVGIFVFVLMHVLT